MWPWSIITSFPNLVSLSVEQERGGGGGLVGFPWKSYQMTCLDGCGCADSVQVTPVIFTGQVPSQCYHAGSVGSLCLLCSWTLFPHLPSLQSTRRGLQPHQILLKPSKAGLENRPPSLQWGSFLSVLQPTSYPHLQLINPTDEPW